MTTRSLRRVISSGVGGGMRVSIDSFDPAEIRTAVGAGAELVLSVNRSNLEVVQSFSDDALSVCPKCHGQLRKVFGSVGIAFKGSGFYITDYRDKSYTDKAKADTGESKGDAKTDAKSDAKPAETKAETKAESKVEAKPKAEPKPAKSESKSKRK